MPDKDSDLLQLGASDATRRVLESLKNNGHIDTLLDGYRLGVAVAIAFGKEPRNEQGPVRKTMFQANSVDDNHGSLRIIMGELFPEAPWPYRAVEDLAEQGVQILGESFDGYDIWYADLLERIEKASPADSDVATDRDHSTVSVS